MTNRFGITLELPKGWVDIIDKKDNRTLCNIRIEYATHMVTLLNELYEETQHLESYLNMVREVRDDVIKENEQLKQRIKELEK